MLWLVPVNTGNTVCPLGTPSLENEVDPPDANRRLSPEVTAENDVSDTPLPQLNVPPLTPQFPFEDVIVKLVNDPVSVNVANVCVDHVPRDSRPPTCEVEPDRMAWMVARVGKVPGVVLEPPLLGGYKIPLDGHLLDVMASTGTNVPSITDPRKWKNQLIAFNVLPEQVRLGEKPPEAEVRAEISWFRVQVLVVDGVIPAFASQVKVGRVWKSLTTVVK